MLTYKEARTAIDDFNRWVTTNFDARAKRCHDDSRAMRDAVKNYETSRYETIESFFFDLREALPYPTALGNGVMQQLEDELWITDSCIYHLRAEITVNENILARYMDILSLRQPMCDLYTLLWKEEAARTDTSQHVKTGDVTSADVIPSRRGMTKQ